MIYAVIDTNVLVSALLSKSQESTISRLLSYLWNNELIPLYNAEIIAEYKDVLSRDYFHFNNKLRDALIDGIKRHGIESSRVPFNEPMLDEDDRVFYEVTLSKDDAYLVTGNQKHFPKTPIVVTPAEMLEILKQD
ncbi:MAG: putative toxin-antitoxin system toxin component, PIN family [Paludibacteraceae bacterium]|nr:putative toxin-antitoxin system toxin component, PIN family [Paludibacteraceae bacterium]